MSLPRSFFFWCFIPGRGVVKAVCEPTTTDPETAEVAHVVLAEDDKSPLHMAPDEDDKRRMDEAAADALADLKRGTTEDASETASLARAVRAQCWHESAPVHPEDAALPAWQEC